MTQGKESEFVPPDTSHIATLDTVNFDGIDYLSLTWAQMGQYAFVLAQCIQEAGEEFDKIVAIAKGGLTWSRVMADYLRINTILPITIESYVDVNTAVKPRVTQPLTQPVDGMRVLLLDDVADGGHTVVCAKKHVEEKDAASVSVVTLGFKPQSIIRPDFYAFETSAWVVFPHEVREFITLSYSMWKKNGASDMEIVRRFQAIGLPDDHIHLFMKMEKHSAK